MTAPAEEIVEQRQAAPPVKHAHCTFCYPYADGRTVPTRCGTTKRVALIVQRSCTAPPNACVVCLDLVEVPCEKCGNKW